MGFKTTSFDTSLDMEETTKNEDDLNSLTVVELKAIAKEKGIVGYSNMNKQQLIDAINTTP